MNYVNNSGVGRGLIFAGEYGNIPFDNRFPTDTKLYKIISTSFTEKADECAKAEKEKAEQEKKAIIPIPERPWEAQAKENKSESTI
jgi:hypothetical protein